MTVGARSALEPEFVLLARAAVRSAKRHRRPVDALVREIAETHLPENDLRDPTSA